MRYAKPGAEKSLAEIFGDFERLGICLFKVSDWERALIKPRLRSGEVLAPAPRMFVRADYWEALSRAERVMHVVKTEGVRHPTWIFTHATAAMAHGLEVPEAIFWPIHYATKRGNGNRSRAALRHHRLMELGEVELVGDVRVSGCSQTVIDCSRAYPFGQALAIADSALRLAKTSREGLRELLRAQPGRRGNRSARRVVEVASPLSESGGESIVRALMLDLGLPEPELQASVPSVLHPGRVYRVDFLFKPASASPVAFELDGLAKYQVADMTGGRSAVEIMAAERQREAEITAGGIRVVRMGFHQASDPETLLHRLAAYGVVPI